MAQTDDVQILAERFGSFDSEDIRLMRDAIRGIGWHMPRVQQLHRALERALEFESALEQYRMDEHQ